LTRFPMSRKRCIFGEICKLHSPFTDLSLNYNIVHAESRLTEEFALRKPNYVEMCKSKSNVLADWGEYSPRQGCAIIRSLSSDLTAPGRSFTRQSLGKAILTS
jgi:hypothetical protein